ncbi:MULTISPECIES: diadenylate cyclase CdaA [Imperialibacter]|uniref:Diadenylate cyclase n=1 Tax=Imperialibacter roseus TaxID=1324217 RepID=A0ABZ0IRG0_9BACT|nr:MULTISPECIES: diadenylate cyclase CdaA [Imperialibacter]WOK06950.1 diadenylate cyclase CdaA [Imperialibacter roseus]CAD5273685.1 Diadenylate cyclase [Imperialibacter sp. 89]CAD5289330.1 Diadenylate cyclase [Imperialibacter sp. 75]VVT13933.1 Diadenylate cyclase [Imperialibacter sp. EC-SDR9]
MILAFKIGFLEIGWVDVIDIGFVSVLLYHVYKLMRGSVAIRVFLGFLFLYLVYLVVRAAEMELLSIILGQFMGVGVLAVIILFQQEIRKFLLIIGRTTAFDKESFFKSFGVFWRSSSASNKFDVTPLVEGMKSLGGSNTGALMVVSKNTELKFYAESGDRMDAILSKRLLLSIFNKYSPLHDGAVIVYEGKIVAARCILPVTERDNLPAQFGLRHRAAIGMSEQTDTLILVVSEETGQLSVVRNGRVFYNLAPQDIRKKINDYLSENEDEELLSEANKAAAAEAEKPLKKEKTSA